MSVQFLKACMDKIERGDPINLPRFVDILRALLISHRYRASDIDAYRIKTNEYQVTRIHDELKREILLLTENLGHDRISAAGQNLSHDHKVMGSFLLFRTGNGHPQVVTIAPDGHSCFLGTQSKLAVLVENRQLFLLPERTLSFHEAHTGLPEANIDMIFSAGNEISNQLHYSFLNQYDHLYLAFDLDLGGLLIAKHLIDLMPRKPMTFLTPNDIEQRLQQVVVRKHNVYIQKVIQLGAQCSPLKSIADLIAKHHRTVEQESFL